MKMNHIALLIIVLVALAVIIVPMKFEKQVPDANVKTMAVPKIEKPNVDKYHHYESPLAYSDEEDVANKALSSEPVDTDDDADEEASIVEPTELENEPADQPQRESSLTSRAWVVQVGSFGEAERAEKLVQELRDANYNAFSQFVELSQKKLVRVYVGPDFTREKMVNVAEQLQAEMQIEGVVTTYQPS